MQSVNLYLPEYRHKREWLSLQASIIVCAVFLLLMTTLHVGQSLKLHKLQQSAAALEQQELALTQRIEQSKTKLAAHGEPSDLKKQAQQLRDAIANRQAIESVIASTAMGNQQGFSQHLFVLGEKREAGLVLNRIGLRRGGEYVELAGSSRSAAAVPLYVHNLQQSQAFAAAKFGFLTITERDGLALFRLSGSGAMATETLQLFGESTAQQ